MEITHDPNPLFFASMSRLIAPSRGALVTVQKITDSGAENLPLKEESA
jgi:hypothetical protein